MRAKREEITYRHAEDTFRLYHLTDAHIGAAACNEKLLKSDIEVIANDPRAIVTLGGDQVDAIIPPDRKRFDPLVTAAWVRNSQDFVAAQLDGAMDIFGPILPKVVGILSGNHEHSTLRHHNRNVHWEFVSRVARETNRLPQDLDMTHRGFLTLAFKRGKSKDKAGGTRYITVFMCHGVGGGKLPGGHALALGRLMNTYMANIIVMGHRHVSQHVKQNYVGTNRAGTGLEIQPRVAAMIPSYLETWIEPSNPKNGKRWDTPITYSDSNEMDPVPLGVRPIILKPYTGGIDYVESTVDGLKNMAVKLY